MIEVTLTLGLGSFLRLVYQFKNGKSNQDVLSHDLWSVLGILLQNDRVLKAGAAGPLTDPVHAGHWAPITSSYTCNG
ncbi:hypothetical protein MRB53_027569 [Persea americana]|uniref:Uncharacterized protein n=1 Tax=Persea americana TaxID=3435 RepID=A0ACC2LM01_PERAE|nr:hypothetical protein MRB53_027569 [Persea americana]